MKLAGKIAIVTGGASGIGLAISQRFAREGAVVAVWDINEAGAQKAAAELVAAGGKAVGFGVDVSNRAQIEAATNSIRKQFGPINILVNNAGISNYIGFLEMTEEQWDRMININLKSVFLVTQAVIPDMLAAGWGRVVNISSSSTQTGSPKMTHYVASKGGVIGFTKALAREYADKGITVNNVPPGFVDTPLLRATLSEAAIQSQIEQAPMKRAGSPDDIAAACAFLASDDAGYITGHTLSVNGGRYFN
ncbi:MAG: SDR family NAD(P)-dependent oxidoreductase [Spongiibacteraceae bacterium]